MGKKKVLNEVRRFMKLANLDANLSSNFVNKLEEMDHAYMRDDEAMQEEEMEIEDEIEVEEEPMMGDEEMEMDMEMDMEAEVEEEAVLTDEEASILIALGQKLAASLEADAEGDVEDAMDDLDDADELEDEAEELEDDAADDLADAAEDIEDLDGDTLEEILDSVLGEETHNKKEKRNIRNNEKHIARLRHDDEEDAGDIRKEEKKQGYDDRDDEAIGAKDGAEKDKKVSMKGRRDMSRGMEKAMGKRPDSTDSQMDEALVQEVLKRVRTRLAAMSKK